MRARTLGWVWAVLIFAAGCSTKVPATNQFDPDGTGPKAPGRIEGSLFVQGEDPAGLEIQIFDDAGTRADGGAVTTGGQGEFLSNKLEPGVYRVEVAVPVGNVPIRRTGVVVEPGVTTDVGLLVSLREPPIGQIEGLVTIADTAVSPANVRVTAIRVTSGVEERRVTYTGATGQYAFTELVPGTYELQADKEGLTPDLAEVAVGTGTREAAPDMRLYPISGVVRFEAQTAVGSGVGRVQGARYTNSRDVDLLMLAFGGVNEMRFSEDPGFMESGVEVAWRDHIAQVPVTLSAGEGLKTIHAQFRLVDPVTQVERLRTETYTQTIVFDQSPPVVLDFVVAPEAREVAGTRYYNGDPTSVPVQLQAVDAFSRIRNYKLVLEGADPAAIPYNDVTSTAELVTIAQVVSVSSGDGEKQVTLQLRDGAGNETGLESVTFYVDSTGPVVSLAIHGGADYTRSSRVSVELTIDEAIGIDEVLVSSSPTMAAASRIAATPSFDWVLPAGSGDGARTLYVRAIDLAGNVGNASDGIGLDTARPTLAPALTGLAIADAPSTTVTHAADVRLALGATDTGAGASGLVEMQVDTDPFFSTSSWVPYLAAVDPFNLPSPTVDGQKRLYVRVRDAAGNVAQAETGILLDRTPPAVLSAVLAPDAIELDGRRYLTSAASAVPLTIVGVDSVARVSGYRVLIEEPADPTTVPFALVSATDATITISEVVAFSPGQGRRAVDLELRDAAGNVSAPLHLEIFVDSAPPALLASPAITVRGAVGGELRSENVVVDFAIGDGPARMRVGEGATPPASPTLDYSSELSLRLAATHGQSTSISGAFLDRLGNEVVATSSTYVMNLRGVVRGRVLLGGVADAALDHAGTSVALYPAGTDLSGSPTPTVGDVTAPDGTFALASAPYGTYLLRIQRSGYVGALRSPVVVVAGETTDLGTDRLQQARGDLTGRFLFADVGGSGTHAGITVSAILGGRTVGTAITDAGGEARLVGLPVATGYEIRASAPGYVAAVLAGVEVIADTATTLNGGTALSLARLSGDFKICRGDDAAPAPKDCQAVLYSRGPELLLGLDAVATHVRFTLESPSSPGVDSFTNPAGPTEAGADLCATPPATQCWNPFDPSTRYRVDVSAASEGILTVLVQFANNTEVRPLSRASVVYDRSAPSAPTVSIQRGATALVDGYTRDPALRVDATASASSGAVSDVAPLATVRLSSDATYDGADVNGDKEHTYGGTKVFSVPAGDGSKVVRAWFCDAAGNCTTSAATASIVLDTSPPSALSGYSVAPSGSGVRLRSAALRSWWTRSTRYAIDLDVGADGALPEVLAFRLSLTSQFTGSAWTYLDAGLVSPDDVISAAGIELPPVDGDHLVYIQLQDAAGNVTTDLLADAMTLSLDTVAPGGTVSLAAGAAYTNDDPLAVTLSTDSAVEIQTSFTGLLPDPVTAPRDPYQASLSLAAPAAEGRTTLLVRFFDAAGNFSERADDIVIDRVPPDAGAWAVCDSCTTDGAGLAYYNDALGEVTLAMLATDSSGIGNVQIVVDAGLGTEVTRSIAYAPFNSLTVSTLEGSHSLLVTFFDAAGNGRTLPPFDLHHDRTAPTVSVGINTPATWTRSPIVNLTISGSDTSPLGGMLVSNSPTFGDAFVRAYSTTVNGWQVDSPTLDAQKRVYVRVLDAAGNAGSNEGSIRLDATPPSLSVSLQGTAAAGASTTLTSSPSVTVAVTSSDSGGTAASGVAQMQVSNLADFSDGSFGAVQASVSGYGLASPTVSGEKQVFVRIADTAGNVTSGSARITLDLDRPTLGAVSFLQGGVLTSADVDLAIDSTGATQMRLTGDLSTPAPNAWMSLSSLQDVTLSSAIGAKAVTVELRDDAGNLSVPASRSVSANLDGGAGSAPTPGTVTVTGVDAQGASTVRTRSRDVSVALTGFADNSGGSGLAAYQISESSTFAGATWIECAGAACNVSVTFTLSAGDGGKTVYARVRDAAGNVSTNASDGIQLDATGPTSATITPAKTVTNTAEIGVTLFALGATSYQVSDDPLELYYDNAALPRQPMGTASLSVQACLNGGVPGACAGLAAGVNGEPRLLYAAFYDDLGNASAVAQAVVLVDNAAPSGVAVAIAETSTVNFVGAPENRYYSRSQIVTVSLSASADSGLEMQLSGDGALDSEPWLTYSASAAVVVSPTACDGAGSCTIRGLVRDAAGNVIAAPVTAQVVLDLVPPIGPRTVRPDDIVINRAYALDIVPGVVADDNFLRFEISGGQYASFADSVSAALNDAGATSFAITLNDNAANTLRVRAVDKAGNLSDDDFTIVVHDDTPPSRPTSLEVLPYNGELRLHWQPSVSTDVARYEVHYGTISELYNGTVAAEGASPIRVELRTAYNLTGLPNGNTMFLAVRAIDRAGNASDFSSEQSTTPSVVAPRLLSQLGGRMSGAWIDEGPSAASTADDRVLLPMDGGLKVFQATSSEAIAFLPNLPDVTQVLFHGGYTFVHCSDPRLGPVASSDEILPGMPNMEAPIRTLLVYSTTYPAPTTPATPVDYQQQNEIHLPDRTAFFYIMRSGTQTVGVSATMGLILDWATSSLVTFPSYLTLFDAVGATDFVQRGDSVEVEPVNGWASVAGRYLVAGGYEPVAVSPPELIVGYSPTLKVYEPAAASGLTPIGAPLLLEPANDGLILPVGELGVAQDVVFGQSVHEETLSQSFVDTINPLALRAYGDPAVADDPLPMTALSIEQRTVFFDSGDETYGGLSVLQPPALVGHRLDFGDGVVHTITSYVMPFDGGIASFTFDPALTPAYLAALPPQPSFTLHVETPPDADTGFVFPFAIEELATSGSGDRIFVTYRSEGNPDPAFGRALHEYVIDPSTETATQASTAGTNHTRDFGAWIQMLRAFDDWLVVLTEQNVYIVPRAQWWDPAAAPVTGIPFDRYYAQILARDGYVYGVVRGSQDFGVSSFTIIDATQPRLAHTVGRVTTDGPVARLETDGNRIYALLASCDTCREHGGGPSGESDFNRNCGCQNSYVQTFTTTPGDRAALTPYAGASPDSPVEVASLPIEVDDGGPPVRLGGIDDLVAHGDEVLFWSQGTSGQFSDGFGPILGRLRGQAGGGDPGALLQHTELDIRLRTENGASRRFGLAVSGQYVFVASGPFESFGSAGISAFKLSDPSDPANPEAFVEVGGTSGVHGDTVWDMQVVGDSLFVFDDRGLTTYDVAAILAGVHDVFPMLPNITERGAWRGRASRGGLVSTGYAYTMTRDGIVIIDVTVPEVPVEKYTIDVDASDLAISGGLLYVTSERDGLRIYELLRPSAMRTGAHYQNRTRELDTVEVAERRAFGRDTVLDDNTCTTIAQGACDPLLMCTWDQPSGTCVIDPDIWTCAIYQSAGDCGGKRGCAWDAPSNTCRDTSAVLDCDDYTEEDACNAELKCYWSLNDGPTGQCRAGNGRGGCHGDDATECAQMPGCTWYARPPPQQSYCGDATSIVCTDLHETRCEASARCQFDAIDDRCELDPTPEPCFGLAEDQCWQEPGCRGNGQCLGGGACSNLWSGQCMSTPGCSWVFQCEEDSYCRYEPQSECDGKLKCRWSSNGSGYCEVDPGAASCATLPDMGTCSNQPGCNWTGTQCVDVPPTDFCADAGESLCDNFAKCMWQDSTQSCVVGSYAYNNTPVCWETTTELECRRYRECFWREGSGPSDPGLCEALRCNHLDAAQCAAQTGCSYDAGTCDAEPGCSWNAGQNQCQLGTPPDCSTVPEVECDALALCRWNPTFLECETDPFGGCGGLIGPTCMESLPIDCDSPTIASCDGVDGCVWDADSCRPDSELLAWDLGVLESHASDPALSLSLDMRPGAVAAFSDDLAFAFGFTNCAAGRCLDARVFDTSALQPLVVASRATGLVTPLAPTSPVATDGEACGGATLCCDYQACVNLRCETSNPPEVFEVVRGASTDFFALLRDPAGHHPNAGIYPLYKPSFFAPASLDVAKARVAGASGCSASDDNIAGVFDIHWSRGVLYAAGRRQLFMPASSPTAADFLSYTVMDTGGQTICGQHLTSFGHLLYILGTDDSTSCAFRAGDSGVSLGEGDQLFVFDISDPLAPSLFASIDLPARMSSIAAAGSYVFLNEPFARRVWTLDVSEPAAPVIQGAFTVLGNNSSLSVADSQLLINGGYTGLNAIDCR